MRGQIGFSLHPSGMRLSLMARAIFSTHREIILQASAAGPKSQR
jgi:hypothetical protein